MPLEKMTVTSFNSLIKQQIKLGNVPELPMHKAPKAFSKLSLEKNPIFIGFEWEADTYGLDYNAHRLRILKSPLKNLINVRGMGAPYEFVSVPASMLWHRKMMQKYFFDKGFHEGFRHSTSHGIHVHISKKAFDKESLEKFIIFICKPKNRKWMGKLAGRPQTNHWCSSNKLLKEKGEYVLHMDGYLRDYYAQHESKSVAVSTWTAFSDTVELRIFANATNEVEFFSKLEFTEAAIYFCKKHDKKELTPKLFKKWILKYPKRYRNLIRYIDDKNL